MRHLVLAFMILLLPLRGWMGDAMATDIAITMAASVVSTTKTVATSAHETSPKDQLEHEVLAQTAPTPVVQAHPDCSGHASGGAAPSAEEHGAQDDHCKPCQACQACHTVALASSLPDLLGAFAAPLMPHAISVEFTSAVAALGQKPPIS